MLIVEPKDPLILEDGEIMYYIDKEENIGNSFILTCKSNLTSASIGFEKLESICPNHRDRIKYVLESLSNKLKKEGERNPYQFTEEEIEERKKNPNIRTLEEQKEIREKLLLSKSLYEILKDNIKEELCFITKGHSNEESRILYEAGIKNLELTKFESLGIKWDIFSQNDVTSFIVDDRMLVTRVDSVPHYITKTRSNVKLSKSLFRTNNEVEGLLEIEEGLNLILINGVVLKRVEEDNTIYGFDKRNYDYQVGF